MERAAEKNKLGLRDYWQIFLRRKWLIILPVIFTLPLGILFSLLQEPVYQADTTIISEELERNFLENVAGIPVPPRERMDMIRVKMNSRTYMKGVAEKVGIVEYLKSKGKPYDDENVVRYLRGIVKARPRAGRLIEISVQHPVASIAKNLADSVADGYVNRELMTRQTTADETSKFIKEQMDFYWKRLTEAEEAIVEIRQKSPLGYLEYQDDDETTSVASVSVASVVNELAKFKTNLFELDLDMQEAKSELQNSKMANEGAITKRYTSPSHLDPEVTRLQNQLANLQAQYANFSAYTDDYPGVRNLKNKIADLQEELDQAKTRFNSLQNDPDYWQERIIALEVRKAALTDRIGELDRKLEMLPERELELARLERQRAVAESTHAMLVERLNKLELVQTAELSKINSPTRVLDYAFMPDNPIVPNRRKFILLAAAFGMAIGFGLTYFLEYFDRSFRSVDELVDSLDIKVLAAIPRMATYESERKDRKFKYVKIICIVSASLLAFIVFADIMSTKFYTRDSFFLNTARSVIHSLREWRGYGF